MSEAVDKRRIAPPCATPKSCTNTNKPREKPSSAIHTPHMLKPITVYGFLCLFALIGDTAVQGSFEESALPPRVTEACQSPSGVEQDRASVSTDDLENYFRKHRVIELSEEVLIGEVTSLDVGKNGDLLIADGLGQALWIFDKDGALKKEISPEACHPGFTMRPIEAHYAQDLYILLSNSGPPGYRFNTDGSCLSSMHYEFLPPKSFSFDDQGHIYGIYSYPSGYRLVVMDEQGKKIHHFDLVEEPFPIIATRVEGSGVHYQDGHIFYVSVAIPALHKYSEEGELEEVYQVRPTFYRPIKRDLPDFSNPRSFFKAFVQIKKESTLVVNFYSLDADKFMLQYLNGSEMGFQIVDVQGNVLAEYLGLDFPFFLAKDGLAYRVVQPDLDEQGHLSNPFIEVYRYVGPKTP